MKQNWRQNFGEALQTYLCRMEALQLDQAQQLSREQVQAEMHKSVQRLDFEQRRGIWEEVGKLLRVSSKEAHNFYHNTWVRQFYDDSRAVRPEIAQLVKRDLLRGKDVDSKALVAEVARAHPGSNFCVRQLQQAICIIKRRALQQMSSCSQSEEDGFSVQIKDCLAFQRAVQLKL